MNRRITRGLIYLSCLFLISWQSGCKSSINEELYLLDLTCVQSIPIKKKVSMHLQQVFGNESVTFHGRIERRGGYSIAFPKHSYELDLTRDIPLGGLPADDDWILNANYIDKTFLRHVISYELFIAMNENNIAARTRYVEVHLDGRYNGLYVLMEKLDKSSLSIDKSDSTAFVFKEPHIFQESYLGVTAQKEGNFHQQTYPKIEENNRSLYLESVHNFLLSSSDKDFSTGIQEVFDIDNLIDWHLLLLVTNNSDGILKNFYLYKTDEETPIRIAPWDYDHSFGRDGDNEANMDVRPLEIERSIMFRRLLEYDWYRMLLRQRWEMLNQSELLSENGLSQRVIEKSKRIKAAAERNFEVWPIDDKHYYDANNFDTEVELILQFIRLRHERLREYFESL